MLLGPSPKKGGVLNLEKLPTSEKSEITRMIIYINPRIAKSAFFGFTFIVVITLTSQTYLFNSTPIEFIKKIAFS